MKIKFKGDQEYQLEAIRAVTGVFEGQPLGEGLYTLSVESDELYGIAAYANRLLLSPEAVLENVRRVQEANGLPLSERLEAIEVPDGKRIALNFSVEMETGTGKTYVYLRTIYELHRLYGFKKFIVAVPSVAIREGVLSNLRLTKEHFSDLYGNVPVDYWVYDSKRVSRLRSFATENTLQILIINIDAFNKQGKNVIFDPNDRLSGFSPIDFIRATYPIVIVDEPQNFESEKAKEALAHLNPLCTLRYSATHRNPYNLLYRLDPVRAYDLGLVKQIEVTSVLEEENFNVPYLKLTEVKATRRGISAKAELDVWDGSATRRKSVTLKQGSDLHELSGGRELYRGYVVDEIDAGFKYVRFANGVRLEEGQEQGVGADELMRAQIRETVREHLNKELAFARLPEGQRLKVLSLFFIDRVANYRGEDAKFRRWFEEAYLELSALPAYASLNLPPVEQVHGGYFAEDRTGWKDTSGNTQADEEVYEKIMGDKERLLSLEEPLRFIFSHSALREGWDNPNVFQICTLNETRSEVKKRQEIGRGLRLPVRENGERSFDPRINRLTVIANESYRDFAKALQTEIEEETGIAFGQERIKNSRERRTLKLKKGWELNEDFRALWERIKHHTRYRVEFDTEDLVRRAAKAIREMPKVERPRYRIEKGRIVQLGKDLETELTRVNTEDLDFRPAVPDLLAYLQRETELTRGTLARILKESGRLMDAKVNPQQFIDLALAAVRNTLEELMVEGIKYERLEGQVYDMMLFESKELIGYLDKIVQVSNSIYDGVVFQSEVERDFAETLDRREDVKLFVKLPDWFEVDTPLGKYRPDWAVVMMDGEQEKLYFICETKGSKDVTKLRVSERLKIESGRAHFRALEVPYVVETSATELSPERVRSGYQGGE
ncbi:MAG: DEAD/DEAH box helicase family protein [Thermus sp.]|uniref:restriction endonuclease n=1 Tax=Thermus sp. TaxID=275 RepID=UPI00391C05A1